MNMKSITLLTLALFIGTSLVSCSSSNSQETVTKDPLPTPVENNKKVKPHQYGGWYCPDNLTGFPAVDIDQWKNVPVVNGRLATQEETRNGTSLILVDTEEYPNAKPLEMTMPKLARFYNHSSKKEELIIVIQAINVSNDSILGFRYLNGGNGSARINEVNFLSDEEIDDLTTSRFVTLKIPINAPKDNVWAVMTKPDYFPFLQPIFDPGKTLQSAWLTTSKVNFKYIRDGTVTSEFAEELFGNQYIQIDAQFGDEPYVEKFLLLENEEAKNAELHIVCGPYQKDFENQQVILTNWAQKVKELSEKK